MQLKQPFKPWLTRIALFSTTTGLLPLLLSCGTVEIVDFQGCAEVPGGALGAVCDNFLTDDQEIKTQAEWGALKASWNQGGDAVECIKSSSLANLKKEIELLCSGTPCDYETEQKILQALDRQTSAGKLAIERSKALTDGPN